MNIQKIVWALALAQGVSASALAAAAEYFMNAGVSMRINAALCGAGIADAVIIIFLISLPFLLDRMRMLDDMQDDDADGIDTACVMLVLHATASLAAVLALLFFRADASISASVFVLTAAALTMVTAMQARLGREVQGPLWLYVVIALPLSLGVILGDAVFIVKFRRFLNRWK